MEKSLEYHRLDLAYCDYQAMGRNISKNRVGKYIVDYQLQLGEGQFGKVYKGIDDESKTEVAVKVIDLKAIREEKKEAKRKILQRLSDN
jgi:serine/threonine protein kinase